MFASHPQTHHYARYLTNEKFSGCLLYNSLVEQLSLLAMAWMNECEENGKMRERERGGDRT
jgi:hypothetical protein